MTAILVLDSNTDALCEAIASDVWLDYSSPLKSDGPWAPEGRIAYRHVEVRCGRRIGFNKLGTLKLTIDTEVICVTLHR